MSRCIAHDHVGDEPDAVVCFSCFKAASRSDIAIGERVGRSHVLAILRAEAERDDIHVNSAQLLRRIIRKIDENA